ncbi:hypothetical protein PAXRUDRAFT_823476 [Paxillus rubicundulus Ve08.2h10]|uniref:Uncharacterized protein n=1 Tax=Paxillus rubicundulus Ve08.2h10 TaxID=930991 RepID=A0A0D0DVG6_9AGAM|nr:hypothetical protein PAXRUDRAFT_823476 [Paxillus rubicundulus Ve08.2h10]
MSEKPETPEKRAKTNHHIPETEDLSAPLRPQPATSRKRKAERAVDRELPAHARHHAVHAEPMTREEYPSDLVPMPPHMTERQLQRHVSDGVPHRRISFDTHRPRRPNMPNPGSRPPRYRRSSMPAPPRTMLQHAWHTVLNSDPLVDSDEECPDEHLRVDYNRRMQVINRLRGRPPTPELEPTPSQATDTITLDTRRPGGFRRRPLAT